MPCEWCGDPCSISVLCLSCLLVQKLSFGETEPEAEAPLTSPASATAAAAAVEVQPKAAEARHYAVWRTPGLESSGVYSGVHAWEGVLRALGRGYHYRYGHRLRRYATRQAALDAFIDESQNHGCALPPRLYEF